VEKEGLVEKGCQSNVRVWYHTNQTQSNTELYPHRLHFRHYPNRRFLLQLVGLVVIVKGQSNGSFLLESLTEHKELFCLLQFSLERDGLDRM